MKKINDTLKKFSDAKLELIYDKLNLTEKNKNKLIAKLTSPVGLDSVLSSLTKLSVQILQKIYSSETETTFGEISSSIGIDIDETERQANILSSFLLIHTVKNRQLLSKKMDKIYPIIEIYSNVNIIDEENLKIHVGEISTSIRKNSKDTKPIKFNEEFSLLLKYLATHGGIISLNKGLELYKDLDLFNLTISSLIEEKLINIHHSIDEFATYFTLNPENANIIYKKFIKEDYNEKTTVNNSFFMLINMIRTFDSISNTGLFLTRQMRFRKIDISKITEAQLAIFDYNNKEIDPEITSDYSIFFLSQLRCLALYRGATKASMKEISHELEHPEKLTLKIFESLDHKPIDREHYESPFDVPQYDQITTVIKIIKELKSVKKNYLIAATLLIEISESDLPIKNTIEIKTEKTISSIETTINFLILMGIVKIESGEINLSEIGFKIHDLIFKIPIEKETVTPKKCLYINPDFSIIIPTKELPAKALYHLLTHTEIIKTDVIIQSEISRKSITNSQKRGMNIDIFLKTLIDFSNNEIPQNLNFLIEEWQNQTIKIEISHAILLKSTHKEFIEELQRIETLKDYIEQISPNHILIDNEYIDEIIKLANKKDAIISLFSDI